MSTLAMIIAACQVFSGGPYSPEAVDKQQLKCQKQLIECYSKKLAAAPVTEEKKVDGITIMPFNHIDNGVVNPPSTWRVVPQEVVEWKGVLKDCILERK